ncbi:acyl-CoA carboxylase subunit epsilon [Microtetraspora sp. NBRC 16547]|uniref:acyl-CoA carboxylase subunit epsilon n=1 Tax=Microtetraspora sp. NBRC 16547 TaxID=3030993 RepID=UPI0025568E66|nr:acyl-CoA carboxylase subunit epsilon [Microtetraspora sp. NBRC 16547]
MIDPEALRGEIVRGDPISEEIAALVSALLSARHRGVVSRAVPMPSAASARKKWANPAHGMRTGLPHGPGAWRSPMLRH